MEFRHSGESRNPSSINKRFLKQVIFPSWKKGKLMSHPAKPVMMFPDIIFKWPVCKVVLVSV